MLPCEVVSPHPLDDTSEMSLSVLLQCHGRPHEQVVLSLCSFDPEKRMSAQEALRALGMMCSKEEEDTSISCPHSHSKNDLSGVIEGGPGTSIEGTDEVLIKSAAVVAIAATG